MARRHHSVRNDNQPTRARKPYWIGVRSLCVVALALVLAEPRPTQAVGGTCGGAERNCVTEWNKILDEKFPNLKPSLLAAP